MINHVLRQDLAINEDDSLVTEAAGVIGGLLSEAAGGDEYTLPCLLTQEAANERLHIRAGHQEGAAQSDLPDWKVTDRLALMENDFSPHGRDMPESPPQNASELLNHLAADRTALADRLGAPGWLYPAISILTTLYVASPIIESELIRRPIVGLAIGSTIALVMGYQRISGVRVTSAGTSARITLGLLLFATLVLLSTSFGLASFGLHWWIAIPAAISFALTLKLGQLFDHQYREKIRRGH